MLREIIKHSLFMIPLLFWMMLVVFFSPTVYIEQIGFFVPTTYVLMATMAATAIWNGVILVEKNFGTLFWKLIFCIIPVELTCLVFFAQFHFITTVVLLLVWLAIHIFIKIAVRKNAEQFELEDIAYDVPKRVTRRLSALVLAVLLLIPSFMSIFVYKLDNMTMRPDSAAISYDGESFEELVKANEDQLIKLAQPVWEKLTTEERIEVMQVLINVESSLLDVEPLELEVRKLDEKTVGGYTGENILVDIDYVAEADAEKMISTICHEVRHAYQHHVVKMLDWSDENVNSHFFYQSARNWRENLKDYIDGNKDFDGYYGQSIERDARSWAEAHWRDYYYCLGLDGEKDNEIIRQIMGAQAEEYIG